MPWLSLLMALISYFTTKKKTNGNTAAALGAAALVGAGTYYVTHETEWGSENLGFLDGVTDATSATVSDGSGNVPSAVGGSVKVPTQQAGTTGFWDSTTDVLKSWGPTGTAAVIGTTALATSSNKNSIVWWAAIGLGAYLILK